ncbi:MAG: bifunctional metallophosphatase/5'-nucleotidase [Spirochaetae bacterium HGW-Spirochaetae-7]|jgi:2',3'-cyclic-nucleotide 2'-phosphodiesterase/3'-nucleotidase|nr:MAG: bifunctional metallophosphatase/5'-nucleotidase [Spirochaetae bacterium HGW-Spirochaetae-7]
MRKVFKAAFMALAVFALASSIASCAHPFDKFAEVPLKITFIETTDVHGAIFPYNFITGKALDTSMAQVATLVAENRAKGDVVLLDDGDVLQGQPTVYYYNFQKTDVPHIWGEVLNYLQYDVVTVGNHDIEAGHPVYDKLVKEVKAPMICANIVKEGTDEPYFPPYAVITRQGVKIAILGLTQPKITEQLPKAFWSGMDVLDMVDTARKWVPIIQAKEKPDILIGLFHAGVDYTYGGQTADTPKNENPSQLVVERVPGFDFIFVGHDHAGWEGKGYDPVAKTKTVDVKDPSGKIVPIYGGLAGAAAIPVVEISLQWDKKAKTWTKSITGSLTPLKGVAADSAFLAKFEPAKADLMAWVERPIGKMVGKITSDEALFGDSAFVDLIHRIQLELCADPAMGLKPAQISFAAPLDSTAYLPTTADGTIKVRDMFSLYKYENFMYTMDLTGEQIKKFMEFTYGNQFATMTGPADHLISFKMDKDGKLIFNPRYNSYDTTTAAYNYDSVAGIKYTVDVSKPIGSRITIMSMSDGKPFETGKTYSVAINSYRGSGGGGHLTKGVGLPAEDLQKLKLVTSSTTKDLRFYMLKWFEKQTGPITVTRDDNWKVLPEDWAAAGKVTDYPLLYPPAK